jgi:hypothetical protein
MFVIISPKNRSYQPSIQELFGLNSGRRAVMNKFDIACMSFWCLLGHPAKNDCSTAVLLDFCSRATLLRSVLAGCMRIAIKTNI